MDFQVPKRPFYYLPIELNLFTWYPLFPLCFIILFFFFTYKIFTSFLQ